MIIVDVSRALPPGLLGAEEIVASCIPDVTEAIINEIKRLAAERLGTTGEDYIQGVMPPVYHLPPGGGLPPPGQPCATVVLVGWLPNAVENGWPGGDMKAFLLAGRNAKTTKDGKRYNTVPFRHGTPGTSGRNFPAMGSAHQTRFVLGADGSAEKVGSMTAEEAARLGKRVHAAAKKLAPTTGHPESGTKWGARLEAGLAPILRPHHRTDIYAGMVREEKTYRNAKQNQYVTFRRVSEASDPAAWIHPGIEGRHLFREAASYADGAAALIIGRAVAAFTKGASP